MLRAAVVRHPMASFPRFENEVLRIAGNVDEVSTRITDGRVGKDSRDLHRNEELTRVTPAQLACLITASNLLKMSISDKVEFPHLSFGTRQKSVMRASLTWKRLLFLILVGLYVFLILRTLVVEKEPVMSVFLQSVVGLIVLKITTELFNIRFE
jgi:hypothetical protein